MCETPPKPERLRLKTCRLFRRDGCSTRGMKSTRTKRMTSWLSTTQIAKEANPTNKTSSGRRTETGITWRGSRSTLLYLVTTTTDKLPDADLVGCPAGGPGRHRSASRGCRRSAFRRAVEMQTHGGSRYCRGRRRGRQSAERVPCC
ncbi:unnamed protein product [Scytosiphon promiscuus]